LFLHGLRWLAVGDLTAAEARISAAYDYSPAYWDADLTFDWVIERLQGYDSLEDFPSLAYLRRASTARATGISYEAVLQRLPRNTVVLEIGAMDGIQFDSLHPFITGQGWTAVLVEPTEKMFAQLQANYAGYENVKCVRAAITDRPGELTLHTLDPGVGDWAAAVSSASKHLVKFYAGRTREEVVPAIRFDQLALGQIDVLQIDTEGHDWVIFDQVDLRRHGVKVVHIEIIWLSPADRLKVFHKLDETEYEVGLKGPDVTAIDPEASVRHFT
jgi:FkbM family methyltransferase